MTAKEWLRTWLRKKRRRQLLMSERDYIDNAIILKKTYYGDDLSGGVGGGLEDKYLSIVERKKEIEFELEWLNIDIKKIEDALNTVEKEYPDECDMMILRHVQGKTNVEIQKIKHYGINAITAKITKSEKEFEMLLNSQRVI